MKNFASVILCILCALSSHAQIYSFETAVPQECSVTGGRLQISTLKYKLGKSSLQWEWQSGATLKFNNPSGLSAASLAQNGGIYMWIYNPTPLSSPLLISFINASGAEKCKAEFDLNFSGWRLLLARFVTDMGHDKSDVTSMHIKTNNRGSGSFYFDFLEFQESITWVRMSDSQFTVQQSEELEDYNGAFARQETTVQASAEQKTGLENIINRVDNWLLWNTSDYTHISDYTVRKKAVTDWINRAKRNYPALNLSQDNAGNILGDGLFADYLTTASDGTKLTRFRDVSEPLLIPLALDYRLNNTSESRDRCRLIFDWYNDQGWAAGSALGSIRFEKLRSSGYFHSLYLLRNDLGNERLNRELETLRWYALYGNAVQEREQNGETADNLRTLLYAKLYYALMQPDKDKAVSSLLTLQKYLNKAMGTAEGYLGTFKPDGSGYHHHGTYFGAYYPDALYVSALVYYYLHDTPFALNEEIGALLKKHLLLFTEVGAGYDVPMSLCGRFPTGTTEIHRILPALAYLSLAMDNDPELVSRIKWLWNPASDTVSNYLSTATTGISHRTTLGEIGYMLKAIDNTIPAIEIPTSSFFLPYSGIFIHRSQQEHIAIKGYSKYIWDFESSTSENLYGRYLSYGQIEYTQLRSGRRNNAYAHKDWNWTRIPGTTVKQLSDNALSNNGGGNGRHRNFSDETFLGGIAPSSTTGVFGYKLHDNTFDKSFRANKSVFIDGNEMLCLGNNICCDALSTPVITTLFQQEMLSGEQLKYNSNLFNGNVNGLVNPVIWDNLQTAFVVLDGQVNIEQTNSLISGYILHGNAPQKKSYAYYMIANSDGENLSRYKDQTKAPFVIERQDNTAHIVKRNSDGANGFVIFDSWSTLGHKIISRVNAPSIIWLTPTSSGYEVTLSDPDMRRPSAATMENLTPEQREAPGESFEYTVEINGEYVSSDKNIAITTNGKTSKINITVEKGKTYTFALNNKNGSHTEIPVQDPIFDCVVDSTQQVCLLSSTEDEPFWSCIFTDKGSEIKKLNTSIRKEIIPYHTFPHGIYLVTMFNSHHSYTKKIYLPEN